MKVLFLSTDAKSVAAAYKMAAEGYQVKLFIKNRGDSWIGEGLTEVIPSWRPVLKDMDLVVCDGIGWGHLYEVLKGNGRPVLGCDLLADIVGHYPSKSIELFEKLKLSHALERVKDSIPMRLEGWWNGRDWMSPFFYVFHHQHFFPHDLGEEVDDMGSVMLASNKSTHADLSAGLKTLTPLLKKSAYRGPVSMEVDVTDEKVFARRLRFGFVSDGLEAFMEGLMEPFSDLLFETAVGVKKKMKMSTDFLSSVRVTIPPFPYEPDHDNPVFQRIHGLNEHNLKHIHFNDVMKTEEGYLSANHSGNILKVTAKGESLRESLRRVYRTLGNISIQANQYRMDIGEKTLPEWNQIKEWGWV